MSPISVAIVARVMGVLLGWGRHGVRDGDLVHRDGFEGGAARPSVFGIAAIASTTSMPLRHRPKIG